MDNGTNVVNDLHIAPSQTILINYESGPCLILLQVKLFRARGMKLQGGHIWMTWAMHPYNKRCWEIPN
jgi:hypothetical protein